MALFGPSRETKQQYNAFKASTEKADARADTAFQAGMDFYSGFNQRNRGMLKLNRGLFKDIQDYRSGRDVSQIFRGQKAVLDAAANQNRRIMEITGGMGTNALTKSDRKIRQLQALAGRQMNQQFGDAMAAGAMQQNAANIQTAMNTQNMLTSDRLAGMQALNQGFANAVNMAGLRGNMFGASNQMDAASRAGIMGMINLGLGAFTGIGGVFNK